MMILQVQAHSTTTGLGLGLLRSHRPTRAKLLQLCSAAGLLPDATTADFNAALRGLALSPRPRHALSLYARLSALPRPRPDALSCSTALQASARAAASAEQPSQLHSHALRLGFLADLFLRTTLVHAYSASGDLHGARKVFDEMHRRDTAAWNALLWGLAHWGRPRDALALFRLAIAAGDPNDVTVAAALSACAQLGSLEGGARVHEYARRRALTSSVRVCNALIDMYAKCGCLGRAVAVFRSMPERTIVSWNSLLMGLAMHGHGEDAVRLFHELASGGLEPNGVTYLAVLCGCNHAGLVDEGLRVFRAMRVPRGVKHYGAVVDLLGRAGRLREAYEVAASMQPQREAVVWQTLLGACRNHSDVGMAERVWRELAAIGPMGCGEYVLLSNVYAAEERWSEVGRVRESMRKEVARKLLGLSSTEAHEVDGDVPSSSTVRSLPLVYTK